MKRKIGFGMVFAVIVLIVFCPFGPGVPVSGGGRRCLCGRERKSRARQRAFERNRGNAGTSCRRSRSTVRSRQVPPDCR